MDILSLAGILIIVGFVLFIISMVVAPPRLYQETDIEVRLGIIAKDQARWQIAQWTSGLAPLITAAGFLLLTISLQDSQYRWLLYLGAAAFVLAGVFTLLYSIQALGDPRAYLESTGWSPLVSALILLLAAAGILYGIVFLQSAFPNWLGYLTIASAVLLPLVLILKSSAAYGLVILFYTVTLVIGIVLLRQ